MEGTAGNRDHTPAGSQQGAAGGRRLRGGAEPRVRLFLVRHGEAVGNVELRYVGARDDPLTPRGREQAEALARALAGLPLATVYTSPLRRALETAGPIAAALETTPQVEERLREQSFGRWEGLTRAEVRESGAEERRRLEDWEADIAMAPPGGEPLTAVQVRVRQFADDLVRERPGQAVVLVSHVGPLKTLICATLAVPLQAALRLFLDSATVSVIDWGRHPLLRVFNAHAATDWKAAPWMAK